MIKTIKLENKIAGNVFRDVVGNLRNFGFEAKEFPESTTFASQGKSDYHKLKLTRFTKNGRIYESEEHEFYNHRFDQEGFRQREYILYRVDRPERTPVLIARDYASWETSMQDSVDEPKSNIQTISVEEDPITEGIEKLVA